MNESRDWETEYSPSVQIFSALAHPLRMALAHHLCQEPHTVSDLHQCLGVSQPLASHHLKILKDANVIVGQRQGRSTIYSISDEHIRHIVTDVYVHTKE